MYFWLFQVATTKREPVIASEMFSSTYQKSKKNPPSNQARYHYLHTFKVPSMNPFIILIPIPNFHRPSSSLYKNNPSRPPLIRRDIPPLMHRTPLHKTIPRPQKRHLPRAQCNLHLPFNNHDCIHSHSSMHPALSPGSHRDYTCRRATVGAYTPFSCEEPTNAVMLILVDIRLIREGW